MKLEKVTADMFDRAIERLNKDQSDEQATKELLAVGELAEDSRACGEICKEAQQALPKVAEQGPGQVRRLFAAVYGFGVRHAWNVQQILEETTALEGMLTDAELEKLRREIQEQP